ncbi:MAG: hypothetical protein QXG01_00825 [Candidatus Bathyarchaeia archaeon]
MKIKETFHRVWRWMGIAGISLAIMILFVLGSVVVYYTMGMGEVPRIEVDVEVYDNSIILNVRSGRMQAKDWEYLVFDERVNPPIAWSPAPADMEPGKSILLGSNLPPATYRVQIRHKPTYKFIFETKVTVRG